MDSTSSTVVERPNARSRNRATGSHAATGRGLIAWASIAARTAARSASDGCAGLPCLARMRARMFSRAATFDFRLPTFDLASAQCRHIEPRRRRVLVGPARGDDLGAGVELDALDAVHVEIAEQGIFPAAEGKERHRH